MPPIRTLPSGEIISTRASTTNTSPANRNTTSNVEVTAGRSQPNIVLACSGAAVAKITKATMVRPEIRKTGLWMSIPIGPICGWMLSWPTV